MSMNISSSDSDADSVKVVAHNKQIQHLDLTGITSGDDEILAGAQLGTLQQEVGGRLVLVPTPSNDPNDPLNWPQWYKIFLTVIVCLAVFMSNFIAAGPTVSIVKIAMEFTGPSGHLPFNISKTAYFFSASSLMQGAFMLFWMPVVSKWGRRPVYPVFFRLLVVHHLGRLEKTYAQELVARLGIVFFSGGAGCLAPLTITDLIFVCQTPN